MTAAPAAAYSNADEQADRARAAADDAFLASERAARNARRVWNLARHSANALVAKSAAAKAARLAADADQAADQAEDAAVRGDAETAATFAALAETLRVDARDAAREAGYALDDERRAHEGEGE